MKESKFKFMTPRLLSIGFSINMDFDQDEYKNMVLSSKTKVNRRDTEASVTLEFEIGDDKNSSPFHIVAVMQTVIKWEDNSIENIDAILSANAPSLLLSYLRPIVSNITASSPYNAYEIPYMDFTENIEDGDVEITDKEKPDDE